MPASRAIGLFIAMSIALALAACDEEPKPMVPGADSGSVPGAVAVRAIGAGESRPVIHDIHFDPAVLAPGKAVRAIVRADDPDDEPVSLSFQWELNGAAVPANGATVTLPDLSDGDTLQVTVEARDRSGAVGRQSARIQMDNRPPLLLGVELEKEKGRGGDERWRAIPQAEDPDGDALEYSYEWVVNSRVRGKEASLSKEKLKRGDEVMVRVTAHDHASSSRPLSSAAVTIANESPEVVSTPPGLDADGAFIYAIQVEDPDGDRSFVYSLAKGPEGMEVGRFDGLVEWRPTPAQVGSHPVELVVGDRNGGLGKQVFKLAVYVNEVDEGAPPASR